jgi:hypothetical protein
MAAEWARFSKSSRTIAQICKEDLAEVFANYSVKLTHVNEIGWDKERNLFGDIVAPFIKCQEIDKALEIASKWKGLALTFTIEAIWQDIMLNLWPDEHGRTNICLLLDPEIATYESDDYEPGRWVLEFLLAMTSALKVDCCGFGRANDYNFQYQPLDCARVLSCLADGSLLRSWIAIHIISTRLISPMEVRAAIAKHGPDPRLEYRVSTAGYHVLFNP